MNPIQMEPAGIVTGDGNVKSTHPHGRPASITTWDETPSLLPGLPAASAKTRALMFSLPVAAPRPEMYSVTLVIVPACGAENFETCLRLSGADNVSRPGVVVPKTVEVLTVMVTGVLFVDTPWLSVTFRTALYVLGVV